MSRKYLLLVLVFGLSVHFSVASEFLVNWEKKVNVNQIQVSANTSLMDAYKVIGNLFDIGIKDVSIDSVSSIGMYKVRVGSFSDRTDTQSLMTTLKEKGYKGIFPVNNEYSVDEARKKGLSLKNTEFRDLITSSKDSINTDSLKDLMLKAKDVGKSDKGSFRGACLPYYAAVLQKYPDSEDAKTALKSIGSVYSDSAYRLKKNKASFNERKEYLEAALDAFGAYVDKYPNEQKTGDVLTLQANCLHSLSQYQTSGLLKTAKLYKQVIEKYPKCESASYAQLQYSGVLFELAVSKQYSWELVRNELNGVIYNYPETKKEIKARSSAMYAETYLLENNAEKAYDEAYRTINQYSNVTGDVALCHYIAGRALLIQKKNEEALKEFEVVCDLRTKNLSCKESMLSMAHCGALWGKALYYQAIGDSANFTIVTDELKAKYPDSRETKALGTITKNSSIQISYPTVGGQNE